MDPDNTLIALQARHQQLLREHAVLEAREAEKEKRRAELRALLMKAGVNPDEPTQELARLEAEISAILTENQTQLDEFEAKLKAATGPTNLPTEESKPPPPSARPPRKVESTQGGSIIDIE